MATGSSATQALLLFGADLSRVDTLYLSALLGPRESIGQALFANDGASLYVTVAAETKHALIRVRRADGVLLERADLGSVRIVAALPLSRTQLATATADGLHVLSPNALQEIVRLPLCSGGTRGLTPFGWQKLYAVCGDDSVVEIDMELLAQVRAVRLVGPEGSPAAPPCDPVGAAMSANATTLYVACRTSGALLYLDRVTLQPWNEVSVGAGVRYLLVTPRRMALIVLEGEAALISFDLSEGTVSGRIPLPSEPVALTVSGDGRWAYAVVRGRDGISELLKIDIAARSIMARTAVPAGTNTVATWPGEQGPVMDWR